MTRRRFLAAVTAAAVSVSAVLSVGPVRRHLLHPLLVRLRGRRTVAERVGELTAAGDRVRAQCRAAGVPWPPSHVTLLALKDERRMAVYAGEPPRPIATHPVLAASGTLGPKRAAGDRQVPEGVYAVDSLNPDSAFDVALHVGYPNAMDVEQARRDGVADPGGDIMIHGGSASVGCLAVGDDVAEELFVLAATVGVANVTIVIAPVDLRTRPLPAALAGSGDAARYAAVRAELGKLPGG